MKHHIFYLLIAAFCTASCDNLIRNPQGAVVDERDTMTSAPPETVPQQQEETAMNDSDPHPDLIGFWVGYFLNAADDDYYEKSVYGDEGLSWGRENKINISIDEIHQGRVKGHSVVAGNNRPFAGTMTQEGNQFIFEVAEPGDDRYDGRFSFHIQKNDDKLTGTWNAYKKIDIPTRKYELQKKRFQYDPELMLEPSRRYGDWEKAKKTAIEDEEEREAFGDFYVQFEAATDKVYEVNASTTLLTKKDVENLKKGDLLIIRNTIYARHGYSFKNRPLRVFFDAQPWYIPVHTDIRSDFTELEKKNIELLLRYEKNAKVYYDTFGRG